MSISFANSFADRSVFVTGHTGFKGSWLCLWLARLGAKVTAFIFMMMWLRWTLPRFRFDQLMRMAWQGFIPVTLALVILATALLYFNLHRSVWALAGNVAIGLFALVYAAARGREITGRQDNMPPAKNVTMAARAATGASQ